MDNNSDREAKRAVFHSQEDVKEQRAKSPPNNKKKSLALPANLKPKFAKKNKKKRSVSKSKESSKDEEEDDNRQVSMDMREEEEIRESEKELGRSVVLGPVATTGSSVVLGPPAVPPFPEVEQASPDRKKKSARERAHAVAQIVPEEAAESPQEDKEKQKKMAAEQEEEKEKKAKEEQPKKQKKTSGRTRKERERRTVDRTPEREKTPPRKQKSARKSKRGQEKKKKSSSRMSTTPSTMSPAVPPSSQQHRGEKSIETMFGQSRRLVSKTRTMFDSPKASDKKDEKKDEKKDNKKTGTKKANFFKTIMEKTRFWSVRKSDCGVVATKEFLARSYVPAEYDHANDFLPLPSSFMSNIERDRDRESNKDDKQQQDNNKKPSEPPPIFINKRPFWLTRGPGTEEPLPKPKVHMFHAIAASKEEKNVKTTWEPLKRSLFYDPRVCLLPELKAVDTLIGWSGGAADEMKCLAPNTYNSTLHMLNFASSREAKRKMRDKSAETNSKPTVKVVSFVGVPKAMDKDTVPVVLHSYSRKDRPPLNGQRTFTPEVYYVANFKKPPKRKVTPTEVGPSDGSLKK